MTYSHPPGSHPVPGEPPTGAVPAQPVPHNPAMWPPAAPQIAPWWHRMLPVGPVPLLLAAAGLLLLSLALFQPMGELSTEGEDEFETYYFVAYFEPAIEERAAISPVILAVVLLVALGAAVPASWRIAVKLGTLAMAVLAAVTEFARVSNLASAAERSAANYEERAIDIDVGFGAGLGLLVGGLALLVAAVFTMTGRPAVAWQPPPPLPVGPPVGPPAPPVPPAQPADPDSDTHGITVAPDIPDDGTAWRPDGRP